MLDTVEANIALGFKPDLRDFGIGAQILRDLGVSTIELLTNSSVSYVGIAGFDISIAKTVEMDIATPISLGNTKRA